MVNMIEKIFKSRKSEKGSFLIEFVMVLPVIIMIMGFVMTVGQGSLAKNIAQNAAFEGARMAVTKADSVTAINTANTTAKKITKAITSQNDDDFNVDMTTNSGGWKRGDMTTCTVATSFKPLFPFFGRDKLKVTGRMSMMVENGS